MRIMRLSKPSYEESTSSRLKTFLLTSIPDQFIVERICRCIYRGQISLYLIFSAKIIYDKVYATVKDNREHLENHFLVFITCIIIVSKSYMDLAYTNVSWTELCHFPVVHINKTERIILGIIDYDVLIPFSTLEEVSKSYGSCKEIQRLKKKRCSMFKKILAKIFSPFMCIN